MVQNGSGRKLFVISIYECVVVPVDFTCFFSIYALHFLSLHLHKHVLNQCCLLNKSSSGRGKHKQNAISALSVDIKQLSFCCCCCWHWLLFRSTLLRYILSNPAKTNSCYLRKERYEKRKDVSIILFISPFPLLFIAFSCSLVPTNRVDTE